MAFPITGVLDTFNRANGNLFTGNWSELDAQGANPQIASNQVVTNGGIYSYFLAYWNVTTFGPDCEAYITAASLSADVNEISVWARCANPGATFDGYSAAWNDDTTNKFFVSRIDDGVATQLGADISGTMTAGHRLGLEVSGTTLTAYHHNGTAWSSVGSRTDSTYSAAGYIGFGIFTGDPATGTQADSFGGGGIFDQALTGAMTPTGATSRQTSKIPAGSLSLAGALARSVTKSFAGSLGLSGSLATARQVFLTLSGSLSLAGSLARQANKALSGSLAPAAIIAKTALKALVGSITSAGEVSGVKQVLLSLAGSLGLSGAMTKQAGKPLSSAITPTGSLIKGAIKAFAGTLTPTGSLDTQRTFLATLAGALNLSGTVIKQTGKALSGSLSPSGGVARSVTRALSGTLSLSGSLAKNAQKALSGALGLSGSGVGELVSGVYEQTVGGVLVLSGSVKKKLSRPFPARLVCRVVYRPQAAPSLVF